MFQRTPEAVYLPHEHRVKLPTMGVGHEAIECRARFLRAGHALIDVLAGYLPTTAGGVFPQLRELHLRVLSIQGADAGVDGDSHNPSVFPF